MDLSDTLPVARGDPLALISTSNNLVVNAAQYASGGSQRRISAAIS